MGPNKERYMGHTFRCHWFDREEQVVGTPGLEIMDSWIKGGFYRSQCQELWQNYKVVSSYSIEYRCPGREPPNYALEQL